MNQFLAFARADLTVLHRTGYLAATAVIVALLIFLGLQIAKLDLASFANVVAAIVVIAVVTAPTIVAGLLVLLERGQGSFAALAVTPATATAYVVARTAVIAVVTAVEMLVFVVVAYDGPLGFAILTFGVFGVAAIACLAAILVVAPFDDVFAFILPMVAVVLFLSAPGLGVLTGLNSMWFAWHPTAPSLALIEAAFAPVSIGRLVFGVLGTAVWTAAGLVLARRAVAVMRLRGI